MLELAFRNLICSLGVNSHQAHCNHKFNSLPPGAAFRLEWRGSSHTCYHNQTKDSRVPFNFLKIVRIPCIHFKCIRSSKIKNITLYNTIYIQVYWSYLLAYCSIFGTSDLFNAHAIIGLSKLQHEAKSAKFVKQNVPWLLSFGSINPLQLLIWWGSYSQNSSKNLQNSLKLKFALNGPLKDATNSCSPRLIEVGKPCLTV